MQSDIKRLIENFFSLSLLKLCNLILPLVTLPYLIKTLSVGTYGVIVMSLSIAMYFQTLIEYGFNLSATRDIARNRENKRRLDLIYSKVII
ncbi:oligosaccharide flippase family protein, partial [Vibrio parahaemolyticus]|uniref:oligosaccharide flippase family protein n=1 Tax=Vibrio parahaemolyticus TaxID=670 RepID=UPI0011748587